MERRGRGGGALIPDGFAEARTEGMLRECISNEYVGNQTERRGEEGCLPRCHSLDVIHQQHGDAFSKPFAEELGFNVQDRFMTGEGFNVKM